MRSLICSILLICAVPTFAQVEVYETFDAFEQKHLQQPTSDTTYVINFWATWCAPCVKELPHFEALQANAEALEVKVLLVSLDSKKTIEQRLLPFLKRRNIQSEVVVLADGRAHQWIDRVDSSWSGAVPATIIITKNGKYFFEKSYASYAALENDVLKLKPE